MVSFKGSTVGLPQKIIRGRQRPGEGPCPGRGQGREEGK